MQNDIIVRNLRIAFDRTVTRGTALDAFMNLVEGQVDYREVFTAMTSEGAPQARPQRDSPVVNPEFKDPVMPVGRHKGMKMSEVALINPGYLSWCIEKQVGTAWFQKQCRLALEIFDSVDGKPASRDKAKKPSGPFNFVPPEEDNGINETDPELNLDSKQPAGNDDDDIPF